jgi:uncharacterized protein YndB with AHSA1/START domain
MGPVSATTTIDAPRERVFEFLSDLANRPAFTDHFIGELRLDRVPSAGLGAGARFRIPGRGLWVETVIKDLEPPHRIFERGRAGPMDRIPVATVWELVEGPGPGGCEVTVNFWTEPATIWDRMRERPGVAGWYRRRWRRALSRLKDLVELDASVQRVGVAGGDRLPS